jgi:N utilization substance protein A
MNKALFEALEMLEREKGIPREYMYEKIEAALVNAFKRETGGNNVKIVIKPEKYELKVYRQRTVVEEVGDPNSEISLEDAKKKSKRNVLGGVVEEAMKPEEFRRLSAITGKQVIVQAIREAERGRITKEYQDKKGEAISGVVDRIEPDTGNVKLDMGSFNATLLKSEQIEGESFEVGQHIKVYVQEEMQDGKPFYRLSRTHPGLVKSLFEINIPEIQDGTVLIMNVAREAGSRTKVSVMSRDPDVDPIGTCVGTQNQRKAVITDELNGEKIDIIKYSEQPEEYVKAALQPATVDSVTIIEGERSCVVYVAADQLSLAIGKAGQNARLAAKLTGMKIDIKTAD